MLVFRCAGVLLQRALPGVAEYRTMPAALLRGWMTGQVTAVLTSMVQFLQHASVCSPVWIT